MRIWAIVLALAAGAGAEEPPVLPNKVRLSRGKPRYKMRRNYALPEGVAAAAKPAARKGRLEKDTYFFFDVDGNGKFNDLGVDGWCLSGMTFRLPLEPTVVSGVSRITWRVEEDGSFVHFAKEALELTPKQRQVLIQFNTWRMLNGLPAVTVSQRLSDACMKHCKYMDHNGFVHVEEEGKTGYTPEGAEAGRRSCLSEEKPGMSILMFYSSFYHRLPLIHPDTTAIGIGESARYTAVDGLSERAPRNWIYPVIVPAPNTRHQPTDFAREQPRPYPDEIKTPGFPITLTFDGGKITEARAELRLKSGKGREVPILLSSPEVPANKKRPNNRNTICIIPRVALAPMKTWWVKVTYKLDGEPKEHEWVFNTGRRRPVFRFR